MNPIYQYIGCMNTYDPSTQPATSWSLETRDLIGGSLLLHLCPASLWTLQPIIACSRHYKSQKGGTSKINHRPRQAELQHQPGIPHSSPGRGFSSDRRLQHIYTHTVLHYPDWLSPHNCVQKICFSPKPASHKEIHLVLMF